MMPSLLVVHLSQELNSDSSGCLDQLKLKLTRGDSVGTDLTVKMWATAGVLFLTCFLVYETNDDALAVASIDIVGLEDCSGSPEDRRGRSGASCQHERSLNARHVRSSNEVPEVERTGLVPQSLRGVERRSKERS